MSKYDKDMEALEVKITIMRLNYEKQAEKRLELEQKVSSGVIVKLRRNVWFSFDHGIVSMKSRIEVCRQHQWVVNDDVKSMGVLSMQHEYKFLSIKRYI